MGRTVATPRGWPSDWPRRPRRGGRTTGVCRWTRWSRRSSRARRTWWRSCARLGRGSSRATPRSSGRGCARPSRASRSMGLASPYSHSETGTTGRTLSISARRVVIWIVVWSTWAHTDCCHAASETTRTLTSTRTVGASGSLSSGRHSDSTESAPSNRRRRLTRGTRLTRRSRSPAATCGAPSRTPSTTSPLAASHTKTQKSSNSTASTSRTTGRCAANVPSWALRRPSPSWRESGCQADSANHTSGWRWMSCHRSTATRRSR
mmetsp:Transcript_42814/g.106976  ORF Transcript_42814/g.106976 Transcript_42814/m.106976 type:complete len:263 (-) Transcript_42814:1427-2215(-)